MPAEPFSGPEKTLAHRIRDAFGWFSVLLALALAAPGVVVTASAEPASSQVRGPSCSAAERSGEATLVELARMMDQLRADADRVGDPSDDVVPLNNRGFYYPVVPEPQPAPSAPPASQ